MDDSSICYNELISAHAALADIQTLLDDFTAKLAIAYSPEATALKDESRSPLIVVMQQLGYYVNSVAQGHLSTSLNSAFPTNSTSFANQIPLKVDNVNLLDGGKSQKVAGWRNCDCVVSLKIRLRICTM